MGADQRTEQSSSGGRRRNEGRKFNRADDKRRTARSSEKSGERGDETAAVIGEGFAAGELFALYVTEKNPGNCLIENPR